MCVCVSIYLYIYIRGGTVHVFVPNGHGTGISDRCMMPYDKYRQFTPNPEGGAAAVQHCLITASRRTANASGDTEAGALMFSSLYFILIKYQLAVKLAMLELMCVCECVCVCVCACECARVCVCVCVCVRVRQSMWAKRSEAERRDTPLNIPLCGRALFSVAHGQSITLR